MYSFPFSRPFLACSGPFASLESLVCEKVVIVKYDPSSFLFSLCFFFFIHGRRYACGVTDRASGSGTATKDLGSRCTSASIAHTSRPTPTPSWGTFALTPASGPTGVRTAGALSLQNTFFTSTCVSALLPCHGCQIFETMRPVVLIGFQCNIVPTFISAYAKFSMCCSTHVSFDKNWTTFMQ